MAVDSHGMPVRIIVTEGSRNNCTKAKKLTKGIKAENLLGDKAYDTNSIMEFAKEASINSIIQSKRSRKIQRIIDQYLYTLRHIIENTFQKFKEWRGIATRYCKNSRSFLSALQLRAILMWANIS